MPEGSSKEIKIIFRMDEQALQRMRTAIADVTRDLQSFVQASRGLTAGFGGGGAGPTMVGTGRLTNEQQIVSTMKTPQNLVGSGGNAANPLAQSFTESANAMKNLSGVSREAMRVMSDVVSRAVQEQKRAIHDLDSQIGGLTERYGALQDAQRSIGIGNQSGQYQQMGQQLGGAIQQRQSAANNLLQLEQQQKSIQNTMSPPPRGGYYDDTGNWVEASGANWTARSVGATRFAPNTAGGWLKAGGLALAGASTITNEIMGESRSSGLAAQRGNFVRGEISKLRGGDLSLIYGLRQAMMDPAGREALASQVGGAAQAEQFFGGIYGGAKAAIMGAIGGTPSGGGGGGIMAGFSTLKQNTGMAQNVVNIGRDYAAADPLTAMALEGFTGSLGNRIAAQHLGIVGGSGIRGSKSMDPYGDLSARLQRSGYDMGGLMGAFGGAVGIAGKRFAGRNAWGIMAAGAAGYGGYGEALGGQLRAGVGGPGVLSGMDAAAAIQLSQGIYGQGFDVTGTTTGTALEGAFQSGFKTHGDFRDFNQVARFQAGAAGLNKFVQGQVDPFQMGRNLMSAIGNAGSGAGVYAQDFLASGMNLKQMTELAYGGPGARQSIGAEYLGITPEMAKRQLSSVSSSLLDRFVDQGQTDKMSMEIRKAKASGMALPDYLRSLSGEEKTSAVKALGVFAGTHGAGGIEAGIGMMGIEAGLSSGAISSLKRRAGVGGGLSGAEKAMAEGMGSVEQQLTDALKTLGPGLTALAGAIPGMSKKFEAFGNTAATADNLKASFDQLVIAVNNATMAFGGKPPAPQQQAKPKSLTDQRKALEKMGALPASPHSSGLPGIP